MACATWHEGEWVYIFASEVWCAEGWDFFIAFVEDPGADDGGVVVFFHARVERFPVEVHQDCVAAHGEKVCGHADVG